MAPWSVHIHNLAYSTPWSPTSAEQLQRRIQRQQLFLNKII